MFCVIALRRLPPGLPFNKGVGEGREVISSGLRLVVVCWLLRKLEEMQLGETGEKAVEEEMTPFITGKRAAPLPEMELVEPRRRSFADCLLCVISLARVEISSATRNAISGGASIMKTWSSYSPGVVISAPVSSRISLIFCPN